MHMDTQLQTATKTKSAQAASSAQRLRNMALIPGGKFLMGSNDHYPEEAPAHKVVVDSFWMDKYAVTNSDFKQFVDATGYVTMVERPVNPDDYPGARPELLLPSSVVFQKTATKVELNDPHQWWHYVPGADWKHPRGPQSSLQGLWKHPVVHVGIEDAQAYAEWVGKSLPTEAEWEFAARGGLDGAEYVWGDEFTPGGRYMTNNWQGEFPHQNSLLDRYEWTSPVGAFPANGYGLYDMAGNVWEWTVDWYQEHSKIQHACCTINNPRGGEPDGSFDQRIKNVQIPRKVMKGGSHLCAPNYCRRYRPAARMAQPIDTATCHLGFRCIVRVQDEAGAGSR